MTEELKKALESAKTDEEKKAIAEKFKEEIKALSEDELDNIAGGTWTGIRGWAWKELHKDLNALSEGELETVSGGSGWMEDVDEASSEVSIFF